MRRIGAGAMLAMAAALGSCVNVPPFRGDAGTTGDGNGDAVMPDASTCGAGTSDADCDGWPVSGTDFDCDDSVATINPGAVDVDLADGMSPDCQPNVAVAIANTALVGSSVETGPYTMRFGSGEVRLPDRMMTHGVTPVELLHMVPGPGCVADEEHAVGYSIYPTLNTNPLSTAGATTTQWNAEGGRAMVHVRVELTSSPPCGPTARLDAQIDFTFFPDGRLVRHDAITPNETLVASSCTNPCSGPQPTELDFTSFYGFADAAFDRYQAEGQAWESVETTQDFRSPNAMPWHCFGSSGGLYRVGTTWAGSDGAVRLKRVSFAASALDFVQDSTVPARTFHARSALFLYAAASAEETCDVQLPALAESYRSPTNLGTNVMDPDTGIYMIMVASPGQIVLLPPRRVDITNVTLPAGTALDVPIDSRSGLTVWRNGTRIQANAQYQVQPNGPGRYVLWLAEPVVPSDALTILGPGETL